MKGGRLLLLLVVAVTSASVPVPSTASPHDHAGKCNPTPAQRSAAERFAAETAQALSKYSDPTQALRDGFRPFGLVFRPVVHWDNRSHRFDDAILDPSRPEALIYANTYSGPFLLGAMFLMPEQEMKGPRFGGCLTRWHTHPLCRPPTGPAFPWNGACPPGTSYAGETPDALHVWVVPMEGGPYAHEPDERYKCWPKPRC